LDQEEKPKTEFIHYCINCGTQLSPEQGTFRCSNCGSTTFKLKKIHKEIEKANEKEEAQRESGEPDPPVISGVITENNFEKSKGKGLETVRAEGIGIFEIDVDGLISGKPLILSVRDGFYEISVQKLMEKVKKR
jgi:predicted  nucleic acid-binding Zn-ribbon protein